MADNQTPDLPPPVFLYPLTFDLPEEEKKYIQRHAIVPVENGWERAWFNILQNNKVIRGKHQNIAKYSRDKKGYNPNQLNEIKKEVDRYLDRTRGETKNSNIAPTRGMKYENNSCWFDALAFVILADPTKQILECLESKPNVYTEYLLGLRRYMYHETDDTVYEYTRPTLNHWGYDTNPHEVDEFTNIINCPSIFMNITSDKEELPASFENGILIVRSGQHINDDIEQYYQARLYGHVFYSVERRGGRTIKHFTSGIYVNNGKFLYYDDNDITIENRLRFLEDVPDITTGGNIFKARWDVYYRIAYGGETGHSGEEEPLTQYPELKEQDIAESKSRRRAAQAIAETKAHRVANRLMQYPESKDHSAYGDVFAYHTNNKKTMKGIYEIAINAVNRRLQDDIRDQITPDTLFDLFLKSYDHIGRALQDGENTETLVFHCENNLSKFLWDVQTTIKNIEKRRNGRDPGIYVGSESTTLDGLDGDHYIFYNMEARVVKRSDLDSRNEVYQAFDTNEPSFERVRFIYQDNFENTLSFLNQILNISTEDTKKILAQKLLTTEHDIVNDLDHLDKSNSTDMDFAGRSFHELNRHISTLEAGFIIQSTLKERHEKYIREDEDDSDQEDF